MTLWTLDIGSGGNSEYSSHYGFEASGVNPDRIGIDLRRPIIKGGEFVQANVETLPFRENSISSISMFDVIEHLDSPSMALREIMRVMCTGGNAILTTPNAIHAPKVVMAAIKGRYEPSKDHVATYGLPELEMLLERCGFSNFKVSYFSGPYTSEESSNLPLWHRVVLRLSAPFPALGERQLKAEMSK